MIDQVRNNEAVSPTLAEKSPTKKNLLRRFRSRKSYLL